MVEEDGCLTRPTPQTTRRMRPGQPAGDLVTTGTRPTGDNPGTIWGPKEDKDHRRDAAADTTGTPPGTVRGQFGGRRRTWIRCPPPQDNAHDFACTSRTTRTSERDFPVGGSMNDSLPPPPNFPPPRGWSKLGPHRATEGPLLVSAALTGANAIGHGGWTPAPNPRRRVKLWASHRTTSLRAFLCVARARPPVPPLSVL